MSAAVAMGGLGAVSSYQQMQQQNDQIAANATSMELQAGETLYAGRSQAKSIRSQLDKVTGSVKASAAGSGVSVDSGSVVDVIEESAFNIELDALTVESDAKRSAANQIASAQSLRSTQTSGLGMLLGAFGSGASGYATGLQLKG